MAFATGVHDHLGYAIKFFLHQVSFEAELALYESRILGNLLPQVLKLFLLCCVRFDMKETH